MGIEMRHTLALATLLVFLASGSAWATERFRPNIVLLNLDDADTELLSLENLQQHYPNMNRLAQRSVHFTNVHCTTPFCAPSRAALFTGKYAFNNGCKINNQAADVNNGFEGGYTKFLEEGHDEHELGVWMKEGGYRTIHVGKYHHCLLYTSDAADE